MPNPSRRSYFDHTNDERRIDTKNQTFAFRVGPDAAWLLCTRLAALSLITSPVLMPDVDSMANGESTVR